MRISELARRSGVSVHTIKYYLRVGLLRPGRNTAHNQARYDESHLRRLRVIRVFIDVGGLSVRATRELLTAIDGSRLSGEHLLQVIDSTRRPARRRVLNGEIRAAARRNVAELMDQHGWRGSPEGPTLQRLTDVCAAARLLEVGELYTVLDVYAQSAAQAAECDLTVARALAERMASASDQRPAVLLEAVMAAVVLGDALLSTVHAIARENALARLFAGWNHNGSSTGLRSNGPATQLPSDVARRQSGQTP